MKERLLFHLRLGDSSSPQQLSRRKSPTGVVEIASTPAEGSAETPSAAAAAVAVPAGLQQQGTVDREPPLVCTCVHSSLSSSAVAVGFERGVVHVYHREQGLGRYGCREEKRWARLVLYPTRALGSGRTSPIESPLSALPPDITCVAIGSGGDKLAVGTSDGFVFVTQAPPPPSGGSGIGSGSGTGWSRGTGFHHKSHNGKRINCLLWDDSGDRLFSVCEGGTVVLARNLRPRRGGPAADGVGITGVMQLLGVHQPDEASRSEPVGPQAFIVAQAGSPGISLDLGRTVAVLPASTRGYVQCDVLLVMTRKRAVLLYFAVGEDISVVAPHKTCVDLNVVEQPIPADSRRPQRHGTTGSTTDFNPFPTPPAQTDLGACLWGPAPRPKAGGNTPSAADRGASRTSGTRGERTPEKRGNPADDRTAAPVPRQVLFAYVAQPGGRLWRVGLFDGEVESMHRPTIDIDQESEENGSGAACDLELGALRAADLGDARVLLCWRRHRGLSSENGGEFALLDPNTHRFVASCSSPAPSIVDVSGFALSPPCPKPGGGERVPVGSAAPTVRQRSEVLGGGVRVLHGGGSAKVTMLYHRGKGGEEAGSSTSSSGEDNDDDDDGRSDTLPAETAAVRRIQGAWRARRDSGTGNAAGLFPPSAASQVPALQLRMPGDFPSRGGVARSAVGTAQDGAGGKNTSSSSSRRRKRAGRNDGPARDPVRDEPGRGGKVGTRSKPKLVFFRESVASRALRLSAPSRESDASSGQTEGGDDNPRPPTNIREINGAGGRQVKKGRVSGGGGGSSSGSESDGASEFRRAAADLLVVRELWPALCRSRSQEAFPSRPDSLPPFDGSAPASLPARGRWGGRHAPLSAFAMAMAMGEEKAEEEEGEEKERTSRQRKENAAGDGERSKPGEEDGDVTSGGSSPAGSSPALSGAGSTDDGENDERADQGQSRDRRPTGGEDAGGFDTNRRPESTRPSIPFPRGQGPRGEGGGAIRSSAVPGFPPRTPPLAREPRKSTRTPPQGNNLFGLGTLLQRSVQAMKDGLQPGGGAMSDDDSVLGGEEEEEEDAAAGTFVERNSAGSGGGVFSSGNEEETGADGGTTSDTGKDSWGGSSDTSELDNSRSNSVGRGKAAGVLSLSRGAEPGGVDMFGAERGRIRIGGRRRGEGETGKKRGQTLFVSGMMGVKRHCLGTLRSRRESRTPASFATVTALPPTAMDDPTPLLPSSQYEVRLNVSRGLGLSINITGNDVRVKGFSPVQGGEIGPAQACGDIQVGDALVCVNHTQLRLLDHETVVRVLKSLLNTAGSQLLLLRFAHAENSPRLRGAPPSSSSSSLPPPPPLPPPKTPKPKRQSSLGTPKYEKRVTVPPKRAESANTAEEGKNVFRPQSWHGSRAPPSKSEGGGGGEGPDAAARSSSASPPHVSWPPRARSHSLEDDLPNEAGLKTGGREGAGEKGRGWTVADGVVGMRPKGPQGGELWGERETGLAGGDGGSRHVYLGDMGHARAQRTLQSIAEDVQGLYQVRQSSEECRFFHGRERRSLTDPSPASLEYRIPPPSTLLAPPKSTMKSSGLAVALYSAGGGASVVAPHKRPADGGLEGPPPLPKELYRGRRRRRPRRRRSPTLIPPAAFAGDGGKGEEVEAEGGRIDLLSCQEVVRGELERLDGELDRQAETLARRYRRSSTRRLVAKMLHKSARSSASASLFDDSPSPPNRGGRGQRGRRRREAGSTGAAAASQRNQENFAVAGSSSSRRSGGAGRRPSRDWPAWDEQDDGYRVALGGLSDDGDLTDSGDSMSPAAVAAAAAAAAAGGTAAGGIEGGESSLDDEEGACDIFLEAVSTGGLQEELLTNPDVEVLGVDPPRPLPPAAYDLQTALESVQHFATQTLAGVVQAKAAAKESREAAAAAGSLEGWEKAWPPKELTKELGLVTARQMAHVMRCDAEPLIQIWMRCFTPVNVKHRSKLWGGLAPPSPLGRDRDMGMWHRQLVCGLLTLFTQVHMSWHFLARPPNDPSAVGLLSLRLETTWFSTLEDAGDGNAGQPGAGDTGAESPTSQGAVSAAGSLEDWDQASGGRRGPLQWDEERAVMFIQDHGAYLEADAVAAAASCREMEWALQEVLRLAEQCDHYKSNERLLHQLLRVPRTPSMRSPANNSAAAAAAAADTLTPDPWTPTKLSRRSPAAKSRTFSSSSSFPLSGGAVSAASATASATKDVGGGGTSTFETIPGPAEEGAVRKALGLRPACSADTGDSHFRESDRRESGDGLSGLGREGRGSGRLDQGSRALGGAPLCLLLSNLGELFRWDVAAAADICADAFPGVRPWNVHIALHQEQEKGWAASAPTTPVPQQQEGGGGGARKHPYPAGDDNSGTRNDATFHAYLWAMMQTRPKECRRDWKVIRRCLQLSLRLSTKLRSLPPDHALQGFCKAATRTYSKRHRRTAGPEPSCSGTGNPEAFLAGTGSQVSRPRDDHGWPSAGGGSGGSKGGRCLRLAVDESGGIRDDSVWRRYSDVVQEVVSLWCQDVDALDLDPLWLLPKLRTHENWSVAFKVCATVIYSWEEEQQVTTSYGPPDNSTAERLERHHDHGSSGRGLSSVLAVFDALADACFTTFDDGDTKTLTAALGAVWAADGSLRRVSIRKTPPCVEGDAEASSPGLESFSFSSSPTTGSPAPFEAGHADGDALGSSEAGQQSPTGPLSSGGRGHADEDATGQERGCDTVGEWVEDSRIVGVVRNLTQRCRGLPARAEETGNGCVGGDGGGDRWVPSTAEGAGASGPSEDSRGGAARTPVGAPSFLELAEAVLDAVGPEATGDILAVCPQLLENMPQKFFRNLADRQAALRQQQALEATLLRQATAAIWSARGRKSGTESDDARTSSLGPRLAWLACEELTSFFQHNAYTTRRDAAAAAAAARRRGAQGSGAPAVGSALGLLQSLMPPHPGMAGVGPPDSRESRGRGVSGAGAGVGRDDNGFERLIKQAVARMDLNLVLPGGSHRGTAFDPTSPCGFCGLALECDTIADGRFGCFAGRTAMVSTAAAAPTGQGTELVVLACGHGFHARCLAGGSSHRRGGVTKSAGWGGVESMPLLCPQCV